MMDSAPGNRWAWVEVNRGAIRDNMRHLKNCVPDRTRVMAVVKADGYGHGAVEVAKSAKLGGASMFATATVSEAVDLRLGGITDDILVLSEPPVESVETLLEYNITPTLDTPVFALALGEAAVAAGKVAPYHLSIDTGMNRVGVNFADVIEFLRSIEFHRGLVRTGTMTHFATADMGLDNWDFNLQVKRFTDAVNEMKAAHLDPGIVHCANSAATVLHPEVAFDMVREGIALYGLHPAPETIGRVNLRPAMSVRARATYVKEPAVGEGVSYGLHYRVAKPNIQIATIPLGYADGLCRGLSNNFDVLYDGQRCRQVGNICMDQCMIEVVPNSAVRSPIKPIERGDIVTIIGKDGNDFISIEDHAGKMGTIAHEITCGFSLRLPRVYV